MAPLITRLATIFGLVALSLQAKDQLKDFCRRWGHATAVVDRRLYIDGGYINYSPLTANSNFTNTQLLYGDLDHLTNGMPTQYNNLSKNATVPDVIGGTLWADKVNKIIYQYGGEFDSAPQDFSTIFGYDVILDQWNESSVPQSFQQRPAWGAGAVADDLGYAYYFGGWLSNKSIPTWPGAPQASSSLTKFDMGTREWSTFPGPDKNGRAEGVLLYLPASDGGLLVYFGGVSTPYGNSTPVGVNMSSISIFNMASSVWYTQTATGDIPAMRSRFCAGATWADDKSSYNIYLYGGASMPPSTVGFDDVYILTLPSFTWIKWYPTEPGQGFPHHSLTCNVISNSQMIIMGGNFPNSSDSCDTPTQVGQHNLNLGEDGPQSSKWDLFYPNITQYSVPQAIIAKVGGGATGGATLTKPQDWDNRDLSVLLSRVPKFSSLTATRSIPTATGKPKNGGASHSPSHLGAILGGAIGGLVGLILLLLLALWCLRRKKNEAKAEIRANDVAEKQRRQSVRAELPGAPVSELPSGRNTAMLDGHETSVKGAHSPISYAAIPVQAHSPAHSGSPLPSPPFYPPGHQGGGYYPPEANYGHPPQSYSYAENNIHSPPSAHPPSPFSAGGYVHHRTPSGHSQPPSAFPTSHHQPQPQSHYNTSPHHSPQSSYPQPYNPALDPLHRQHFPPPPQPSPAQSQLAPTMTTATPSAATDDTHPGSQTNTPANFYPVSYGGQSARMGSRGKFVEGD